MHIFSSKEKLFLVNPFLLFRFYYLLNKCSMNAVQIRFNFGYLSDYKVK